MNCVNTMSYGRNLPPSGSPTEYQPASCETSTRPRNPASRSPITRSTCWATLSGLTPSSEIQAPRRAASRYFEASGSFCAWIQIQAEGCTPRLRELGQLFVRGHGHPGMRADGQPCAARCACRAGANQLALHPAQRTAIEAEFDEPGFHRGAVDAFVVFLHPACRERFDTLVAHVLREEALVEGSVVARGREDVQAADPPPAGSKARDRGRARRPWASTKTSATQRRDALQMWQHPAGSPRRDRRSSGAFTHSAQGWKFASACSCSQRRPEFARLHPPARSPS